MYMVYTFAILEKGTLPMKVGSCFLFALSISPLAWLIKLVREHVIRDTGFIEVLLICLLMDMIIGIWKHLKQRTFDWKRLYTGLIEKVGITFIGMVVFNLISDIKEWSHLVTVKEYIILVGKLTNLFYVAGSAFNSMYIITGGKFPPLGWMKRMHSFDDSLNPEDLTKENNNQH